MANPAGTNLVHRQGGFYREPIGTCHSTCKTQIFTWLPDEGATGEHRWYIAVAEWHRHAG